MGCLVVAIFSFDADMFEIPSFIVVEFEVVVSFDVVNKKISNIGGIGQMAHQKFLIVCDEGLMVLDKIF